MTAYAAIPVIATACSALLILGHLVALLRGARHAGTLRTPVVGLNWMGYGRCSTRSANRRQNPKTH